MNVRRSVLLLVVLASVLLTGCRGGADSAKSEPKATATTKPAAVPTPTPTPSATPTATKSTAKPTTKTLSTTGRSCTVLEEPLRLFPGHTLSIANRGTHLRDVQELQSMINGAEDGHHCIPEDGDFGPITRTAVQAFQEAYDLTGYGVVGEDTWNQLNLILSH